MQQFIVTVNKLNKRRVIPQTLQDKSGIIGVVNKGFTFLGDPVAVNNPALGNWYKDRDNNFYWGGGVRELEPVVDENAPELVSPDRTELEKDAITPSVKRKIEQVVNVFETGSAQGNYSLLVKMRDYNDPQTNTRIVQVTYGRSQTTEFGNLKALVQEYINSNGTDAAKLQPFLNNIGKKPSLATNDVFCNALIDAGKNDPVMKTCQDHFFDATYYLPAFSWFNSNGFTLPLSLLVIYDSKVHSGGILSFLRNRFSTLVPVNGGNEQEWITNYVNARHNWLANSSNELLRKTIYRTACFKQQIQNNNWDLSQNISANGVIVS